MNKSNAGLTRWIKEAMVDEREGNPCRAIGCVHKEGARDVEVYTVTFTADKTWEAENLAAMFEGKAAELRHPVGPRFGPTHSQEDIKCSAG